MSEPMNPAVALWKYLHEAFPDVEFDADAWLTVAAYCEQPADTPMPESPITYADQLAGTVSQPVQDKP